MVNTQKIKFFLTEFVFFGLKELRACLFAGAFFAVLFLSKFIDLGGLPRYDFLLVAAVLMQILMLVFRLESFKELCAICLFHVIGLALEIFKTSPNIASWSYPEFSYFRVYNVPLYSGFMYAAVGSYMIQAWRVFDLKLYKMPHFGVSLVLCVAIYANFFTHHFVHIDFRYVLLMLVMVIYASASVAFTPRKNEYKMPLVLAFFLIGFFIWIAENIATFFGAWVYPNQATSWHIVGFGKISSWVLLAIISFIIVALLKKLEHQVK